MFPDAPIYSWVVLPILIFLARITDVSLGTVRLIFVSRGYKGANGPVQIVLTIVRRRGVGDVVELVNSFNPQAFYSIEDVDIVERGVFPIQRRWHQSTFRALLRPFRNRK